METPTDYCAIRVGLYEGNTLITGWLAGHYREDVKNAGVGDGHHSYYVPFPDSLRDGKPHQLKVAVVGAQFEIPADPSLKKTLTCSAASNN